MYRYLYVSSFRQWWAIILIFPLKTLWEEKETSLAFPKVFYYHHIKYYYHNREHLLLRLEKCSAIRSFVIAIPIYPGITTFSCRKLLRSNTWRAKTHWNFANVYKMHFRRLQWCKALQYIIIPLEVLINTFLVTRHVSAFLVWVGT